MTGLEIQRVLALRGPNIWARFPVLEVWVDLGPLQDSASDELPGFNDRLKAMLPTLIEHRCSVGERGGFFQRLDRGTYLAHIFEHVVLELQSLAGPDVGYGKTRETSTPGVYKMAIEYEDEELGRAACELGREVCLAAVHGTPIDVPAGVARLKATWEANKPPVFLTDTLAAAKALKVPAQVLDPTGLIQLGYGAAARRVRNGLTDRASGVGGEIVRNRELTRTLVRAAGVPVPAGRAARSADAVWAAAQDIGLPVVLRPRSTEAPSKATGPLSTEAEVRAAFAAADDAWVWMVDPYIPGEEYSLLVVGGKLAAALDADGRDVTDRVHPDIADRAADAAFTLKLDVAAVEVRTPDLALPLEKVGGAVLGVHAGPDLAPFAYPVGGAPRPVARAVVEALFPEPRRARIPVVAVTGTNGKTTTTRLTAHILAQVWGPVGMACSEGVYVGGREIMSGDCSGPKSAKAVLRHPDARAAVLETARGGLLREGLGFDRCDVGVVTNIASGDHLGRADIDTPEQLAGVKETIVWCVAPWGTAVLNAADPLVVGMRERCAGAVIFFAADPANPVIAEHRAAGGKAVFVRRGEVVLAEGETETPLVPLARVPLTHGGRVGFQVENALASAAAAWAAGAPAEAIRRGLETFSPRIDQTPGRFNLMDLDGVTVVIDFGHNSASLARMLEVLGEFPHRRRHAVYSAAGDRRDEDMIEQGKMLGEFFDRVVVYEDTYMRGREPGEIIGLFRRGAESLGADGRAREVLGVRGGLAAVDVALDGCRPGDLLLIQADRVADAVTLVDQFVLDGGREVTFAEALALAEPRPEATTATPHSRPVAKPLPVS